MIPLEILSIIPPISGPAIFDAGSGSHGYRRWKMRSLICSTGFIGLEVIIIHSSYVFRNGDPIEGIRPLSAKSVLLMR